jgi:ADP-ribose pyrophosphatase YjhB (NUDIX family)
VERRRRIDAYGVCHDDAGRVLLVRASARSARPGTWLLPGGGIEHGEDPADAVVRELAEETGLRVEIVRVREVAAELAVRPPYLEHTDGVLYDVAVVGGALRPEDGGTSDATRWGSWEGGGGRERRWVDPAEAMTLPVSRFAAHALGLPPPAGAAVPPGPDPGTDPPGPRPRPPRGQRFGVYGLVTRPDGRILLTLIADRYPGAGKWHLPGGGTDFGEQPVDGLLREITEESGQVGRISELLAVTHHHNRSALGPEGFAIDWHGVRAIFRVAVAAPTVPRVWDVGGSTAQAAWFARTEAAQLPLTELTTAVLDAVT